MSDSESPLRKRRRSTGGSLAKRIALENATIPICFDDQKDKVYNLPWSDLLQENELPFVNYEDLMVGIVVLAPWKHRGSGIHYSKACVVDAGYKPQSSCVSGEGPSTPVKSATPKKRQSPRKPRKTGANRKLVKTAQVRSPTKKPDGKGQGHTKSVSQDTIRKKASEAMDHNILAILGNKDASDSENADLKSTSKDGQNSNSGNGLKGGSGAGGAKSTVGAERQGSSGAGGAKSTVGDEGQGSSGAGGAKSTAEAEGQGSSGAGGAKSTAEDAGQGSSGAGGAKSTAGAEGQGSSGAGGAKSTAGDEGQGSSGAGGAKSTIGAEPMELEEGDGGYSDECHYYDGHIGTETDVQTTPHTVFTRGNQDYNMRRSFSQPPHHRSPQPQMAFQVPTPLSRRYTYPPYFHGSYSDIDWPHLSDDDISLFSQPSGVSNEHVCGMSSKDLSFVYNTWIAPLTEKLKDIEAQFQAISMGFCVPPSTPSSLNSSKVIPCSNQLLDSDSFIDQYSTSRRSSLQSISSQPPQTYTSSPPELFSDNQHLPTSSRLRSSLTSPQSLPGSSRSSQAHCVSHFTPGSSHSSQTLSSSQPMTESCNSPSLDQPTVKSSQRNAPSASATTGEQSAGVFLGYPEKDKHRVWVQCKKEDILAAESSAGDYNQLANALLDIVFKEELLTPDKYCCTSSKGKELLDEEKMRGIRIHLHRKYLNRKGIKLNSDEEKVQWKDVKKKMNNHIRYLRRRSKETKDSAVEVDMDI